MIIDTLAYTKHLVENGEFDQKQAEALVEAQRDHVMPNLATKGDIKAILNRLDVIDQRSESLHHALEAKISRILLIATGLIIASIGLFTKIL